MRVWFSVGKVQEKGIKVWELVSVRRGNASSSSADDASQGYHIHNPYIDTLCQKPK